MAEQNSEETFILSMKEDFKKILIIDKRDFESRSQEIIKFYNKYFKEKPDEKDIIIQKCEKAIQCLKIKINNLQQQEIHTRMLYEHFIKIREKLINKIKKEKMEKEC